MIEPRLMDLTRLYDAAVSLGTASSLDEIVEIVACYLDPEGAAACALLWFDDADGVPAVAEVLSAYPSDGAFPGERGQFSLGDCHYRGILVTRDLLVIADCEEDGAIDDPSRRALLARGQRSLLSAPLVLRGRLAGRMLVTWSARRSLSASEQTMAAAIARQAPAAAERLILMRQSRLQIEELERLKREREAELAVREALQAREIEAQQARIEELSTPTIPVASDILLMPLIGRIDADRARKIMTVLLASVAEQRATTAILDISGVPSINAGAADSLLEVARAVKLLGAEVILTGVRPGSALALSETMSGVSSMLVRATVKDGIALALSGSARDRRRR